MNYVYAVPVATTDQGPQVLLVQRNIYLQPRGCYRYAAIARNAIQKLYCGGRTRQGESPIDAAARELAEQLGIRMDSPSSTLKELYEAPDGSVVYQFDGRNIDVNEVNDKIASGKLASAIANNVAWYPVEQAFSHFGNLQEYQSLPWVALQLARAQEAGFEPNWITQRVNGSHDVATRATAKLLLDGQTVCSPNKARMQ